MVVAAQDRAMSEAYRNIAHPAGAGRDGRSQARFPDPQGPRPEAADGGEYPVLPGPDRARDGAIARPVPQRSPADAATAFLEALRARLLPFAGFVLDEIKSRRWASVTFQGARHEIDFRLEGEGAEAAAGRFLGGLDARDFALKGHLLANLTLVAQERHPGFARIRLDALTVEEK